MEFFKKFKIFPFFKIKTYFYTFALRILHTVLAADLRHRYADINISLNLSSYSYGSRTSFFSEVSIIEIIFYLDLIIL